MNEPRKYLCLQNPNHGEFVALDDGVQKHCPKYGYAADSIKGRFVWKPAKSLLLMLAMLVTLAASTNAQQSQIQSIASCKSYISQTKYIVAVEHCASAIRSNPKTKKEIANNKIAVEILIWLSRHMEILSR